MANTLNMLSRRTFIAALASSALLVHARTTAIAQNPSDSLPSWNDGAVKKSITDFVARVTTEGSADFVPPAERIATFDLDGTLLSEQPLFAQLAFTVDRIKALRNIPSGQAQRHSRPFSRTTSKPSGPRPPKVGSRWQRPHTPG